MTCPRILTLLSLTLCIVYSTAQDACAEKYTERNGVCYKLINFRFTYAEARAICKDNGGDLVSIPDEETHKYIVKDIVGETSGFIFIGYINPLKDNNWVWSDGTVSSYQAWGTAPNLNIPRGNDCAGIYSSSNFVEPGDWLDGPCTNRAMFICGVPAKVTANTTPGVETTITTLESIESTITTPEPIEYTCPKWMKLNGNMCYKLVKGGKTWDAAQNNCQKLGKKAKLTPGNLATITDKETQTFLVGNVLYKPRDTWIGASDVASEGNWIWKDGSAVSFENWALFRGNVQEPSGGPAQNCAVVVGSSRKALGMWDDLPCTRENWSICQFPAKK